MKSNTQDIFKLSHENPGTRSWGLNKQNVLCQYKTPPSTSFFVILKFMLCFESLEVVM